MARVVNNTVYQSIGSNLGWDIFKKEGTSEKRCVERQDWDLPEHFVLRFQDFTLHLCYSWDTTKWSKVFTKTDYLFRKPHEEFGKLQIGSGNSKKLKFDGLLFCKTCIPAAKTLYT